jgi:hypothetical protein
MSTLTIFAVPLLYIFMAYCCLGAIVSDRVEDRIVLSITFIILLPAAVRLGMCL